jgi:hypothetical protein
MGGAKPVLEREPRLLRNPLRLTAKSPDPTTLLAVFQDKRLKRGRVVAAPSRGGAERCLRRNSDTSRQFCHCE